MAIRSYWLTVDISLPSSVVRPGESPIPIVTEVSGRIQQVYVSEGAMVRAGDPLIQLDTREILRKRQALESRIHWSELYVAKGRSELPGLYRELRQTQLDLVRCTITSPVTGRIVSLMGLRRGEMISEGAAVAVAMPRKDGLD